jgi:hypothetical protein
MNRSQPSDRWVISLCSFHHGEQHRIGVEKAFSEKYQLNLGTWQRNFARRSPHRGMLGLGSATQVTKSVAALP